MVSGNRGVFFNQQCLFVDSGVIGVYYFLSLTVCLYACPSVRLFVTAKHSLRKRVKQSTKRKKSRFLDFQKKTLKHKNVTVGPNNMYCRPRPV